MRETLPVASVLLTKSLLEPRVVAYGGEVVVSGRVLAEPREQLDGPPEWANVSSPVSPASVAKHA